jgi:hypothetical protein
LWRRGARLTRSMLRSHYNPGQLEFRLSVSNESGTGAQRPVPTIA